MGRLPDPSGIFYLAIFGLICAVLGIIGGGAWLIYFLIYHVQIV